MISLKSWSGDVSKTKDLLRTVRVFNNYEFFGEQPYIVCKPRMGSRSVTPASWTVFKLGEDLGRAWYDYKGKTFPYHNRETKKIAFEKAKKWAGKRFKIKTWKRCPFGGYGEEGFVKARLKELREKAVKKAAESCDCNVRLRALHRELGIAQTAVKVLVHAYTHDVRPPATTLKYGRSLPTELPHLPEDKS
jgi:hypothetical protein